MPDDDKQNPFVEAAVKAAMGAVTNTATKRSNDLSTPAVRDAMPELIKAAEKAVAANPEVQHVLNTERHFWQKRTFWSTVYSAGAAIVPAAAAFLNYMNNHAVDGKVTAATIILAAAAGYAATRAGIAVVPLGASQPPAKEKV